MDVPGAAVGNWEKLVAEKRQRQADSIPKDWIITVPPTDRQDVTRVPEECGLLTAKELEITNVCDVDALLAKLARGEWSAVDVTLAFYKRAIVAHQVTNCLTEIFVERALARANDLDAQLKATGKVAGPLHGLPISLKDQLAMKGIELTMGYASWVGQYSERDSVLVEILYDCGAVPFVRTNVPQTLMWGETYNHIFGRTSNPYNRTLTSGGSSGGEGALVAMNGSPLGIGSDIGGSIRIPAAFCGLYGHRPSYHRVPYEGAANSLEGQDAIPSVLGPISSSISGVKAFMKAVTNAQPWLKDPLAVRKSWDEEAYALAEHGRGGKLCIAVIWDDGVVVPHPPITRALEMAKKALEDAGHTVVEWRPLNHAAITKSIISIWNSASAEDYRAIAANSGEPLITTMHPDNTSTYKILEAQSISAFELWALQKDRRRYRKAYLDTWMATKDITGTGRPVDAILAPCAPYAAPPHGNNWYTGYTNVWNALDYPTCVFPVTKVDPSLDAQPPLRAFLTDNDKKNYEFYDLETFKNAPVNLQLIGRTLEEEAVIRMTEIVDDLLTKARAQGSSRL